MLVKSNVLVAFGMAIIEVVEFLATDQILTLINQEDYNVMIAWTLWTYVGLFIMKVFTIGWLVFGAWDNNIGFATKVAQFTGLYIGSNFLPYGDFIVDLGYKKYAT